MGSSIYHRICIFIDVKYKNTKPNIYYCNILMAGVVYIATYLSMETVRTVY
jgi:hypothetical protein